MIGPLTKVVRSRIYSVNKVGEAGFISAASLSLRKA